MYDVTSWALGREYRYSWYASMSGLTAESNRLTALLDSVCWQTGQEDVMRLAETDEQQELRGSVPRYLADKAPLSQVHAPSRCSCSWVTRPASGRASPTPLQL